jgi:hypothetical protein
MYDLPIIHCVLYKKIKNKNNGNYINITILKEEINRTLCKKGGLSKIFTNEVISEMILFKMLNRISFNTYQILERKEAIKKVNKICDFI